MLSAMFATIFGLSRVNKWAKEDVKEKQRRKNSNTKYYFDKHGNWRVTSTGQKATYDDFREDSRQFYRNADMRKYELYQKRVKMNNASAKLFRVTDKNENGSMRYSIFGLMRQALSFDDWIKKGKEVSIQYVEEIIHDDYFYHLPQEEQDYYLGHISWDDMHKIQKVRDLKKHLAPEAYPWAKKHYNITDDLWNSITN